ncbi:hypothetical protein RRG08_066758 [Elysia crispata]|uniref:Uncharacterized protein n=1 Tax=Elysia crispata TaxID=231223 RepID=A0AAE0XPF9_9GAST|nr:hypothetical protein RRG08_066758 [Elysia crispata]
MEGKEHRQGNSRDDPDVPTTFPGRTARVFLDCQRKSMNVLSTSANTSPSNKLIASLQQVRAPLVTVWTGISSDLVRLPDPHNEYPDGQSAKAIKNA